MPSRAHAFFVALLASVAVLLPLDAAAQGQTLYTTTFGCSGCHLDPPDTLRRNAAGAVSVLNRAIAINAGGWMGRYASTTVEGADGAEPVTATQRAQIVAYLATTFSTTQTQPSLAYHGSTSVTLANIGTDLSHGSTVITGINTGGATNGTVGAVNLTTLAVNYTHTANNCNNGSFTFQGTGTGATTTTRTVSIPITAPAAPVANASTSNIAYSTGATAIPLTLSGGPALSIVIDSQPSVGSVSPSGLNATYTASSTQYASTVTFTYHVVGPCANSGTATVTINVGAPPAPNVTAKSQTVQANTTTNVSLTANVSGIFTPPITISTPPANGGAVVVGGTTVDYTPNTNFSGIDTFQYTATGPGGTSTPATVTITVTAAPLTAPVSATTPFNTAIPINLTSGITGAFTSVAVFSPATNGTAMVTSTNTITYTPNVGFFGTDTFEYTATGAGGTSTPATVTVTVNPPPPVTANRSVAVNAGSSTAIDLSGSITGVYTSVSVVTPPTNGSASAGAGATINYTPNPGFVGNDSFTYRATGPGGNSNTSTVTVSVIPPPPPGSTPLAVTTAFNTSTVINIGQALTGSFIRAIIITEPINGTATVNGTVITYTPKPGFFGTDTLAFAGLGLGGISPTQILTITVAPPGPPTVSSREVSVPFNTAVPIDLSGSVSGASTGLSITTQPAHGTVTLSGNIATYRPANNYTGADSFAFAATGPGGTSAPATVSLTVQTAPPVAAATTMAVALNGSGTIDLQPFISGSGITGVAITTQPAHGTATVSGTKVTYAPSRDFFGTDTFRYVAFGNAGDSPPATITVTIIGRPDPTKNPTVTGLIDAQGTTAQRMGRAQISNFQQRLQSLHNREPAPETGSRAAAAPALPLPQATLPTRPEPVRVASAGGSGITGALPSATTDALSNALANSLMSLAASQSLNVAAATGNGATTIGGWSIWAAGTIGFGNLDVNGPIRFRSDGVSAGVDKRVNPRTVVGFGVGYARDEATLGPDGSKNTTDGASFAAYGSFQPSRNTFVDGLLGYASLDMDSNRFVPMMSEFAKASRRGEQWFGSIAAGYEYRIDSLLLSPYGRLDYARTRLKQATETGGGAGAIVYHPESITTFQGVLGLRAESQHDTRFGSVTPRARLEYSHEFEGDRTASISYADQFGTQYTVTPFGTRRNALLLGIGSDFNLGRGMKIGLDYQTRRASRADVDQMFRIQFTQDLDRMGPTWFAPSTPFEDPVRFDATFTYDDNVNRAREDRDILADRIFNFGVSKGRIFRLNPNTRVVGNLFVTGEEFYRYTGLSRFSGGGSAELQYRTSGDFDATTFGLQLRGTGDYYDSVIRRGYKASLSLTARQALTDRIDAFAALTGTKRWGRSAVFDMEEYGARVNLDYALGGVNGALYLTGEYRRGDVASSARFSLESIDVAEVFTADDAFPPGYFAYRFEAKTWIGTLGYNRPLGPRDAIDISWRRAQSTPTTKPTFNVQGPFRYDVNQYSITYLMRF